MYLFSSGEMLCVESGVLVVGAGGVAWCGGGEVRCGDALMCSETADQGGCDGISMSC